MSTMTLLWSSNSNCHLTLGKSEHNFILQLYFFNRDIMLTLMVGFTCMSGQVLKDISPVAGALQTSWGQLDHGPGVCQVSFKH